MIAGKENKKQGMMADRWDKREGVMADRGTTREQFIGDTKDTKESYEERVLIHKDGSTLECQLDCLRHNDSNYAQ